MLQSRWGEKKKICSKLENQYYYVIKKTEN